MIDADKLAGMSDALDMAGPPGMRTIPRGWLEMLFDAAREALALHAALVEARDDVESWASYASQYFREKHDLAGELAKLDAVIAASQPPAEGAKP